MKYRVMIDVGHAEGTAARSKFADEHEESRLNALELKAVLESFTVDTFEVDVIDFPQKSNGGDLSASVRAANAKDYDALVSLHCDFSGNVGARGAHVCFNRIYKEDGSYVDSVKGKCLAKEVASRLCPWLPGRADEIQARPDKVKKLGSLAILRDTRPPAVLVECGFVSNEGDMQVLRSSRHECMRAVALGVAAFCDSLKRGV